MGKSARFANIRPLILELSASQNLCLLDDVDDRDQCDRDLERPVGRHPGSERAQQFFRMSFQP